MLLFTWGVPGGQVVLNGRVDVYVSCVLSHLNMCTRWWENVSCAVDGLRRAEQSIRYIMSRFLIYVVAHQMPQPSPAHCCALQQQQYSRTLSHLSTTNFPFGPAASVSGQEIEDSQPRSWKTSAVSVIYFLKPIFASCVRHLNRAYYGVCSFLDGDLQFLAVFIPNELAPYIL